MEFFVNGRNVKEWELSDKELYDLLQENCNDEDKRKFLTDEILDRFKNKLVPQIKKIMI